MVFKRSGKWHYRFTIGKRTYQRTTGCAATAQNKETAVLIEAQAMREVVEAGAGIRRIKARGFSDASTEFIKQQRRDRRAKPQTAERIAVSFVSLRDFFKAETVSAIDAARVDAYKASRVESGIKDITLHHDLTALSLFFKWAVSRNYARDNPVKHVAMPSGQAQRIYVVSPAEERAYFQHAKGPLRDVATIMLEQGCRPMEVLSLRKEDVDFERGIIRVRITETSGKRAASERTLYMTPNVRAVLGRRMEGPRAKRDKPRPPTEWLFPNRNEWRQGRDTHVVSVQTAHNRVLDKIGAQFVLYSFRHTWATRMVEAGCDLVTLAAMMGHSGLKMVMAYCHPTSAHQRAAMERFAAGREKTQTVGRA